MVFRLAGIVGIGAASCGVDVRAPVGTSSEDTSVYKLVLPDLEVFVSTSFPC